MNEPGAWYRINNIGEYDSPLLAVFPERVKQNIATAIRMAGGVDRLRPHVKTHKSPEVCRLMQESGITKFKCATIAEAEMLGLSGAPDVLLAYQPLGPKLRRFIELIIKYPGTRYSCLTDHKNGAKEISDAANREKISIPAFLDLNVGMNRTGIKPGHEAVNLYRFCRSLTGILPLGLHTYDGHIRDRDFAQKKQHCDKAFLPVDQMKEELIKDGFETPLIVAGGSPTFSVHAGRGEVECSPGTFIYWDKGYLDLCPEQEFLPAAVLVTRVISLPAENRICCDLGHKSVAAENEPAKRIFFLNAEGLTPVSQSEEHLVLETGAGHSWQPGDILYGLPYHICPTVALYERVYTVEKGNITGEWMNTARDRKISV